VADWCCDVATRSASDELYLRSVDINPGRLEDEMRLVHCSMPGKKCR
jgi:hypothetical protein